MYNSDTLIRMIAYEEGELNDDEVVELFQDLITAGLVWQLQGHYGRTAARLIECGACALSVEPDCTDEHLDSIAERGYN